MSRARRAIHKSHAPLLIVVGVVAAVIALGGVAIAQFGSAGKPSTQPAHSASHSLPNASPSAGPPTVSSPAAVAAGKTAAAACAAELRTTEAVITAARNASEHWREHVQSRTDLLSGKNSLEITKAIWKRTRAAGPADIAAVNSALAEQASSQGGCARLTGTAAGACKQRLAVLHAAATADRAAATDWANHLQAMAAHAAGDFGAEHAQELWVAAWSRAPRNLNAAARATAALADAPACKPA